MSCIAPVEAELQQRTQAIRTDWIWVAAIAAAIAAAAILRVWSLPLESLDGDEIFSYRVASSHALRALALIRDDLVHPPLYYFLLKACIGAVHNASPLALRFISLASGITAVALLACFGFMFREMRMVGLVAASLLAANNVHIFYSQEARSYALYTLLVACLLTWSWQIERFEPRIEFWVCGGLLMAMLAYTHYVGAVYAGCIVLAVSIGPVSKRAKLRVWLTAGAAAFAFLPWILLELGPAFHHHGVRDNLSWESAPGLYDLKAIWADYLGIPPVHTATTVVLFIGLIFAGFSVWSLRSEPTRLRRRVLTTLICTAFIPPVVLFVAGMKPLCMPIFGTRHLLPSIIGYLLLVADGLIQLSKYFRARANVLATGVTALVILELIPTAMAMKHAPRRMSYQAIVAATQGREPLYTTFPYGIASTMNYYENGSSVVTELPSNTSYLPPDFVLIFRPGIQIEEQHFAHLLQKGCEDVHDSDFYNGSHAGYTVRVAEIHCTGVSGPSLALVSTGSASSGPPSGGTATEIVAPTR